MAGLAGFSASKHRHNRSSALVPRCLLRPVSLRCVLNFLVVALILALVVLFFVPINTTTNSSSAKQLMGTSILLSNHAEQKAKIHPVAVRYFNTGILTENITTMGENANWFELVPEEDYLQSNQSAFVPKSNIKNALNYSFLISGEFICRGIPPQLLMLIPSSIWDTEERAVIRDTWIHAAERKSWPGASVGLRVKHVFVIGKSNNQEKADFERLGNESRTYEDIVVVDFIDTYRNLTTKVLMGLKWVDKYCPNVQFVMKTDQDTFINVPLLEKLIQRVDKHLHNRAFVMGLRHNYKRPTVVRDGPWSVSLEEYPLAFYPAYMYGHAYVISVRAVKPLLDAAARTRLIPPEDAFLTGILPKIGNVTRVTAPSFTVCCREVFDCEIVWNMKVAMTDLTVWTILQLWDHVTDHTCDDSEPFL